MRRISIWFLAIAILCTGGALWYVTRVVSRLDTQRNETAEVILEQMRSVAKLVTAEGYFSEIYDYKDYYQWDIQPLRKKALMRVKAKVSMGYDLEKLRFDLDPESGTITITDLPSPEIIALDHDVDYYDLTSGTFNRFTEEDLNTLNDRAKNYISQVALQSNLVDLAHARKEEMFRALGVIAETAGFELVILPAVDSRIPDQ